ADGWHAATLAGVPAGTRYRFDVDGQRVPDPASRQQFDDADGDSVVVDPRRHAWQDTAWRGRPWHEAVIYELHVGAFTPEGTYAAAAAHLPELAALGITAIELMPLADFPGRFGWGYDGTLPYAPDTCYGTPDELKALVDRAHAHGLMVFLDVVYNHFGPDGNFLHGWCPEFFNPDHQTPWGAAINFDGAHNAPVRQFFLQNALYWVEEFHMDGLRLDAIHQIRDDSPLHIVHEIAARLHHGPGRTRHVHLILENERNDAALLARGTDRTPALATAQWNDDFHHAAHVGLTGEDGGFFVDYGPDSVQRLARALAQGFVYQGERSEFRDAAHGTPSAHLPSVAFISFLQNHDQIGNRALGERMHVLAPRDALEAIYACLLLAPHVPMFFMGEEFAASSPFLYFCDFSGDLGDAVTAGRRAEFANFPGFSNDAARAEIPAPTARATFLASKLRWEEREQSPHRERLDLIGQLLAVRQRHLTPRLAGQVRGGTCKSEGKLIQVRWALGEGTDWHLIANLGDEVREVDGLPDGRVVYSRRVATSASGSPVLGAHAVRVVAGATAA
ncbi:MAG: malto-oligosyltrehalose trehalohydrolase, partial [Pseudomonadota bacterium]|nr:malto-oligosyltrehalose trehalohydrolase [Pseudomonadota bacterium]